jgi:hypothetical protein
MAVGKSLMGPQGDISDAIVSVPSHSALNTLTLIELVLQPLATLDRDSLLLPCFAEKTNRKLGPALRNELKSTE